MHVAYDHGETSEFYGFYTYKCAFHTVNANLVWFPDWLDTFELLIMTTKLELTDDLNHNQDTNRYENKADDDVDHVNMIIVIIILRILPD